MVLGNTTILVRHLPSQLSSSDREELLKLVGAVSVRVMPDDGKMKGCVFATFQNVADAKDALFALHQREILGKRLVVEYATNHQQNYFPHLSDCPKTVSVVAKETSEKEALKLDMENFSKKLHGVAPSLGLDYLPSPLLKYKYPPASPSVIQNISHALISVPKFYTQVLHLMNKMNLPAPFGPVTPLPPLAADVCAEMNNSSEVTNSTNALTSENMTYLSEEESEYESDSDDKKQSTEKVLPIKRVLQKPKQGRKRKKMIQLIPLPNTSSGKPRTEPTDVFESQPITQKEISIKKIDQFSSVNVATVVEPTGGFGAFEASKEVKDDDSMQEIVDDIWSESQFITLEKIKERKISSREMKTMSIFRNYSPGEPSLRLYIKNLARQVQEKDLRYIFGRFIDKNSEDEKNMFAIQLFKEGRMKGQAFITLANEKQAILAVKETNGFVLHTKPMVVQFARSAKPKENDKKEQK